MHVYRDILREASYLPPVCRAQIEPRIKNRFRKHRHDATPGPRLQMARHEFRNLRAANLGSKDRMYRVLLFTFGRAGWRRRALFTEMRKIEQPASSDALKQALEDEPARGDWLDQWDTKKLMVFIKSQAAHNPRDTPWPKITSAKARLDPATAVPDVNAWGVPFHEKVQRTKTMTWWKRCAYRILPPLPRSEWELLKQLALGKAGPEWDMPARRTAASATFATPAPVDDWDWEKYAVKPIRDIERPNSRRLRIYSGITSNPGENEETIRGGPAIGIHKYTLRFWRRLYGMVWQMTPMMEKTADGSQGGWKITWGGSPTILPTATSAHDAFFEGVDSSDGRLLEGSTRKEKKKRGNSSGGGEKMPAKSDKSGEKQKSSKGPATVKSV